MQDDMEPLIHFCSSFKKFEFSSVFRRSYLVVSRPMRHDLHGLHDDELACLVYKCRDPVRDGYEPQWFIKLKAISGSLRYHNPPGHLLDYLVMSKADAALLMLMFAPED